MFVDLLKNSFDELAGILKRRQSLFRYTEPVAEPGDHRLKVLHVTDVFVHLVLQSQNTSHDMQQPSPSLQFPVLSLRLDTIRLQNRQHPGLELGEFRLNLAPHKYMGRTF